MAAPLVLLAGLVTLVVGAELLVRGGARLALRLGVRPLVIGLTVVAVGTSIPELAVGLEAVFRDAGDLAVGNIAGTNIVNILLILGLIALISPIEIHAQTLRLDLPAMLGSAVLVTLMAIDMRLSRFEGILLLAGAVLYTIATVSFTRREARPAGDPFSGPAAVPIRRRYRGVVTDLLLVVVGIAVTIVGADWLVDGAVRVARDLGVTDAVIGLTIVAIGTSAPELVTAIVSTVRGERDIAVGNLIGSSVYNVAVILGITIVVAPAGIVMSGALARIDLPLMTAVIGVCVPVFLTQRRVTRLEGGLFVLAYATYVTFLLLTRT